MSTITLFQLASKKIRMDFHEANNYLLSLGNEVSAMKLGLENIRTLLSSLGDPQYHYLKVQVAGTNGKGSVCAFLNSMIMATGMKVGMYTSPHLVSITERVQINGDDINEDDFARIATTVRKTSEELVASGSLENVPTFFEQVTAIALIAFSEAEVQLAILETGLGGRLDATTAANADVKAITRIDLDHQKYLGETIEEIAAEKAAIIDDGINTVVIGAQSSEALGVILDRCRQLNVEPVNDRYSPWRFTSIEDSTAVQVETTRFIFPDVRLGLDGRHQIENAETAINVMQSLRYDWGVDFEDDALVEGLTNAQHPGRLEKIGQFLLDGAHNPGGARALRRFLEEKVGQRVTMIFGAMSDKNSYELLSILCPRVSHVVLTRAENSRSSSPEELLALVPTTFEKANVTLARSAAAAISTARKLTVAADDVILITGSLYLVGECRRILTSQNPEH